MSQRKPSKILVPGDGPIPAAGMIVGMNPGEQEEIEGRPFVGRSGLVLSEALVEAGLSRNDLFVTNVYKFRTPGNREPLDFEVEEHLELLLTEIEAVQPKAMLLLGGFAVHIFFPSKPGITKVRGMVIDKPRAKFVLTYHPSYVLRMGGVVREQFQYDVNNFAELLNE